MDFSLPEEVVLVRDAVRRFVDRELMPLETQFKNDHDIPDEVRGHLQAKVRDLGFWALDLPVDLGGGGLGELGMCVAYEELSRCLIPAFRAASVFTPFLGPVLLGTQGELRERFLMPVIRGEQRTCFGLTEPNGGSDPSQMKTSARRDGDRWIVNGAKIFITGADKADFIQLFARTGTDAKGQPEIGCFLIELDRPGVRLGQCFELMSPDRPWEVVFDNVEVPAAQLIGGPADGWKLARSFLDKGRLVHGPKAIGRAERALALATDYARERVTFGEQLSRRQAVQWWIADSTVEIHAARLMTYHAASLADAGVSYHAQASAVKLYADEMLVRVIDRAIQIHGGIGLSRELPLELMFRDARSRLITEGSSEMQRIILSSEILSGRRRNLFGSH
jgi:acyl-CoA dehydrogenase